MKETHERKKRIANLPSRFGGDGIADAVLAFERR